MTPTMPHTPMVHAATLHHEASELPTRLRPLVKQGDAWFSVYETTEGEERLVREDDEQIEASIAACDLTVLPTPTPYEAGHVLLWLHHGDAPVYLPRDEAAAALARLTHEKLLDTDAALQRRRLDEAHDHAWRAHLASPDDLLAMLAVASTLPPDTEDDTRWMVERPLQGLAVSAARERLATAPDALRRHIRSSALGRRLQLAPPYFNSASNRATSRRAQPPSRLWEPCGVGAS